MSIKNRILIVGVGQGGGNIAYSFEKLGYTAAYINSSNHDLADINTDFVNKFHLSGANGCSRDRVMGENLFKQHGEDIIEFIVNTYPNKDIIFVAFTNGGGTGAGIGPLLINALADIYPDIHVGAMCVNPDLDEVVQSLRNGAVTISKVSSIHKSATVFILDNNKGSKLKINREFASLFDSVINFTKLDKRGIIDDNEILTLLTTSGVSVILNTYQDREGRIGLKNSVFADYTRSKNTIAGISCKTNEDIVQDVLYDAVGSLRNTFIGYNEDEDVVILSGLSYNKDVVDELVDTVKEKESEMDTEGCGVLANPFADEESASGYVASEQKASKKRDRRSVLKSYFK